MMDRRINLLALFVGLTLTISCGGGGSGKGHDQDDPIDDPVSDETPVDDPSGEIDDDPVADPTGPTTDSSETPGGIAEQNPGEASPLSGVTSATNLKTLSVAVRIPEDNGGVTRAVRATSIVAQVTRVYVEALIDGVLFGTVDLARSSNDILLYAGSITIPVNVSVTLHAVAVSADNTTLFETSSEGLTATEFGSPAIELNLQRMIPLEPAPRANTAPVIKSILVADRSAAYGQVVAVTVDAEDPQDDAILYSWQVASGPEGVDLATLMSQANNQGAIFTAPSAHGVYSVQITVSDTDGASSSQAVVINVSETGLDDSPDVQVRLSDFPDCVRINSSECISAEGVATRNYNYGLTPNSIATSFRYPLPGSESGDDEEEGGWSTYSANQMFAMGFTFEWTDTCTGNNFLVADGGGNHVLSETSSQFRPTFLRSALEAEACQITLTLRNLEGATANYSIVFNMDDVRRSGGTELDCAEDPERLAPKVNITCPDDVTTTPQSIRVSACDAQGDLLRIGSKDANSWAWYRSSDGRILYGFLDDYTSSSAGFTNLAGGEDEAEILVYPFRAYLDPNQLAASGADGYVYVYDILQSALVQPVGIRVTATVEDALGNSASASCVMGFAPDVDLTPVIP